MLISCLGIVIVFYYVVLIEQTFSSEKVQKILVSATVNEDCMQLAKAVLQEENDFKCISTESNSLSTTEQVKQSK